MPWEPFDPVSYLVHIVIGGTGLIGGLVALFSVKGSRLHVRAGRAFVYGIGAAAVTALVFQMTSRLPVGAVLATLALYLLATGVLSLRHPLAGPPGVLLGLMVVPTVLAAVVVARAALASGGRVFLPLLFGQVLLVSLMSYMAWDDWAASRGRRRDRRARINRHLFRMVLAIGVAGAAVFNIQALPIDTPVAVRVGTPILVAVTLVPFYWRRKSHAGRRAGAGDK